MEKIKRHFDLADKVVEDAVEQLRDNFNRLTNAIRQTYSEINKGEIIITTGAFSIIITLLIRRTDTDSVSYEHIFLLKNAVSFLFFAIMLKFFISRLSARTAERERDLTEEALSLLSKLHLANVKLQVENNPEEILKTPQIVEQLSGVEKQRSDLGSNRRKNVGIFFNWLEYGIFIIGAASLLLFFLYNV